ncbi:MAG: quinone-dependent dihydroorotate dehydrogenase [Endozoicomonadaceae bacterium]|nr:quinone-dependent dihydroorotate dehydrogenase [Endozoicomonadaceae bacterium]
MYKLIRNLLFTLPPECSHTISMVSMDLLEKTGLLKLYNASNYAPVKVMGIDFPNPVGVAAGLDKNGEHIQALGSLGFGFIETGTVTPRPQPGNPKPRLFRLTQQHALINRMGFNNKGVDYLVEQIKKSHFKGVLGVNIGKNRDTPAENAIDDYTLCMRKVYSVASYITVNLSSPNTPGLRDLQYGKSLNDLLDGIKEQQQELAQIHRKYIPVAIKIAPDITEEAMFYMVEAFKNYAVDAIIATNTTTDKSAVQASRFGHESGGLSGAPLTKKSTQIISSLTKALNNTIPVIGVGGIMTAEDAMQKITAGASLVQLYSGFIYNGPGLIKAICQRYLSKTTSST